MIKTLSTSTGDRMRTIILIISVLFLFAGANESYASNIANIGAVANYGDETWFITFGDGAAVFNKNSKEWKRTSIIDLGTHGFGLGIFEKAYITEKWVFVGNYRYDKKSGEKYLLPGYVCAIDADYVYLYAGFTSAARYSLKDNQIIPGHLSGIYQLTHSIRNKDPQNESIDGSIFIIKDYLKDGGVDWYSADYVRNNSDAHKIKMNAGPVLLIKRDNVTGNKEVIENASTAKIFRKERYLYFGPFERIDLQTFVADTDKEAYQITNNLLKEGGGREHFITYDQEGYWFYSNGKIFNFGDDYKLKKELNIIENFEYRNPEVYDEVNGYYVDDDIIWFVFKPDYNKIYGINKTTGERYNYTIHLSPAAALKQTGKSIGEILLLPGLMILQPH